MYDRRDEQRLRALWDSARETSSLRNRETVDASNEISKGKTQYFEKIALGSAATIAALVSYLGSHGASLHPKWLLRSVLVALVGTMSSAMLRNWFYPFYVFNGKLAIEFRAKRETEKRKAEYLHSVPVALDMDSGAPIDMQQWSQQHHKDVATYDGWIRDRSTSENRAWNCTMGMEYFALTLATVSMLGIVLLAWFNF
jgi:hypothetical protein